MNISYEQMATLSMLNNEASKPDLTLVVLLEYELKECGQHRVHRLMLQNASSFFKRLLDSMPESNRIEVEVAKEADSKAVLNLLEHAYGKANPVCDEVTVELALKYKFNKYCYDLLVKTPGERYLDFIRFDSYLPICQALDYLNQMSYIACCCDLWSNPDKRIAANVHNFYVYIHELIRRCKNEGRSFEYLYTNLNAKAMKKLASIGPENKCWNYDAFMIRMWKHEHPYDAEGFEMLVNTVPVDRLSRPFRKFWTDFIQEQNNPKLTAALQNIDAREFPYDKIVVNGSFSFTAKQIMASKDCEVEHRVPQPDGVPLPWLKFTMNYRHLYVTFIEGLTWKLGNDALDRFPMINASIKVKLKVLGVPLTIESSEPFNTRGMSFYHTDMEKVIKKIENENIPKDQNIEFVYRLELNY